MDTNERIAREVLGWDSLLEWAPCPDNKSGCGVIHYKKSEPPQFDRSPDACFEMEEKIKEKGWDSHYYYALSYVVFGEEFDADDLPGCSGVFELIHATAAQRAAAAIKMLDQLKGEG